MFPMSPVAIILIVMTMPISLVQSDCRKTFFYHPKYNYGYEIVCTRTSSLELSTTMANNAISLNIVNSNITFESKTLKYLKKIRQLNITNTEISFLNQNTTASDNDGKTTNNKPINIFNVLTHLETLIIQHCNIKSNGTRYLHGLDNLLTLKLDNDTIENFPGDAFKQLGNLRTLSLNNNRIKQIQDLSICNLKNLRELHLGNNLITELKNDDINCLKQLEVLNLSGNALTKLHGIASTSLK